MESLEIKYKAVDVMTGDELAKKAQKLSRKGWVLQHVVINDRGWFYGFFAKYS
jgi:hypothetical protein